MSNIQPTIGRSLHFYLANNTAGFAGRGGEKFAAILAGVNENGTINVCVFDHNGQPFPKQGLRLVQEGDDVPPGDYLCWMPFQVSQVPASAALVARIDGLEAAVTLLQERAIAGQSPSLGLGIEHPPVETPVEQEGQHMLDKPAESQTITSSDVGDLASVLGGQPKQE